MPGYWVAVAIYGCGVGLEWPLKANCLPSRPPKELPMCRNIKKLCNFESPASEQEIRDVSLQFLRKLSGFNVQLKANEAALEPAVEALAASAQVLMQELVTNAYISQLWRGARL
jgi:hypothetical protein